MADQSIRKEFIEGVQEIFTTLFNNGNEETDGVFLYLMSDETQPHSIYGETKNKVYKEPKLLVCKAILNPTQGEQDVESVKEQAEFVVTLKSLQDNELGVTSNDLENMRKGVMKFHDTFYSIDNIIPKAYVEDVFLMYRFMCTENKEMTSISVSKGG